MGQRRGSRCPNSRKILKPGEVRLTHIAGKCKDPGAVRATVAEGEEENFAMPKMACGWRTVQCRASPGAVHVPGGEGGFSRFSVPRARTGPAPRRSGCSICRSDPESGSRSFHAAERSSTGTLPTAPCGGRTVRHVLPSTRRG